MNKVLSASKCGFPCERNLFYSVNSCASNTSPHSQRIFDVGTALEPVVVEWLRSDGWIVEYNQGSQNAPIEVEIDVEGGKLTGHPDCIISKPDGPHNVLVDIKTITEALRGLDDDELSSELMKSGSQGREMRIINEPGMYKLIFKSRKAEAKEFTRWVTHLDAINNNLAHSNQKEG